MAETERVTFSHKELAEILVKNQNLHKGIWGLYVKFGLKATNIAFADVEGGNLPSAVVPVMQIGLQKFDEETNISVDAAKVNPSTGTSAKKRITRGRRSKSAKTR